MKKYIYGSLIIISLFFLGLAINHYINKDYKEVIEENINNIPYKSTYIDIPNSFKMTYKNIVIKINVDKDAYHNNITMIGNVNSKYTDGYMEYVIEYYDKNYNLKYKEEEFLYLSDYNYDEEIYSYLSNYNIDEKETKINEIKYYKFRISKLVINDE